MEFTFSNYEYKWENNIRIGMIKPHQFQLYLENKWHIQGIRKYLNNKQRYVCIYIYIYTSFFVSFILYNWHVNLCVIRVVCFLKRQRTRKTFSSSKATVIHSWFQRGVFFSRFYSSSSSMKDNLINYFHQSDVRTRKRFVYVHF
jgi:hypothetical protein